MKIEARFYETYEICEIIDQILRDQIEYLLKLEGFHCDGQWISLAQPFEKYSAFHKFIEFVLREVHSEQACAFNLQDGQKTEKNYQDIPGALLDLKPEKLPIEHAFDHYGISYQSFVEHLTENGKSFQTANDDDVYQFMQDTWLTEPYEALLEKTVKEVFHVLFQNRELLLNYNNYVSSFVERYSQEELADLPKDLFNSNGTLKRLHSPSWAQKAVFFRDRGRCVLCDKDLSGTTNLENIENYDHIVPLARFGLNDVTNLQLLCAECNQQEKRDKAAFTSRVYQSWYSYDK